MKVVSSVHQLSVLLASHPGRGSLGFVPTMGALHKGHISLIKKSLQQNALCICSIFVNPAQFNNKKDFKNYPNRLDKDLKLLRKIGCDVVFIPSKEDIYPNGVPSKLFDFGLLDKVMEGASRPGHFNGVAMVVSRLFEIINPQRAYFGEKDFQQLAIIKSLTAQNFKSIEIIPCDTLREKDGLAMSSRNLLLDKRYRAAAPRIYQRLLAAQEHAQSACVSELRSWVENAFMNDEDLVLDYFEIADAISLKKSDNWSDFPKHVACIAVFAGTTRLIDNILLEIN